MKQCQSSQSSPFSIVNWNIGNPSIKRAQQQAIWLQGQSADVLVLTECKNSEGCRFLEKYFRAYGYNVLFPKPDNNEYAVMLISKHQMNSTTFSQYVDYLASRTISVSIEIPSFQHNMEIIGVYVPSRDSSLSKIERKKKFINSIQQALSRLHHYSYRVFCGDLNVLEPKHVPHYKFFETWEYELYDCLKQFQFGDCYRYLHPMTCEYSWIGRTGDGYRYDHLFSTMTLLPSTRECYYVHEPRNSKLSDHSALITKFDLSKFS